MRAVRVVMCEVPATLLTELLRDLTKFSDFRRKKRKRGVFSIAPMVGYLVALTLAAHALISTPHRTRLTSPHMLIQEMSAEARRTRRAMTEAERAWKAEYEAYVANSAAAAAADLEYQQYLANFRQQQQNLANDWNTAEDRDYRQYLASINRNRQNGPLGFQMPTWPTRQAPPAEGLGSTSVTQPSARAEEKPNQAQELMQKVKDAGLAGIISYMFWELAFWGFSAPWGILGFRQVTGHWPDFDNGDDVKQLGAGAFAFVNVARFAVPLRIGLALSTVPWVQSNVVERLGLAQRSSAAAPASGLSAEDAAKAAWLAKLNAPAWGPSAGAALPGKRSATDIFFNDVVERRRFFNNVP